MTFYVPGTEEKDPAKVIRSLQQAHEKTAANTTDIVTNTANITTNTTNIATNTADIAAMKAAWTTWAPTVTPGSGAFTTVSASGAYLAIGKLVNFTVSITITSAGTAASTMSIALPIGTANRASVVLAEETASVGLIGFGRIAAGGTTINSILKYDNTTYIASGNVVTLTGIYERT